MMLTINQVKDMVIKMPPGSQMEFGMEELNLFEIPRLDNFNFCDRVLERIYGAAYEWFYEFAEEDFKVSFFRLPKPYPLETGLKTYVSPDQRYRFTGCMGRWLCGASTYYNQDDIPILDRIYYSLEDVRQDFEYIRCCGDRIKIARMRIDTELFVDDFDLIKVTHDVYQLNGQWMGSASWLKFEKIGE